MSDFTPLFVLPKIPAKSCGVYCIQNTVNGKKYIGSSFDIAKRLAWHVGLLDRGVHPNRHLQAAWSKYGRDAFRCDALEITTRDTQYIREQHYLDSHKPQYNFTTVASGGSGIVGEVTRQKHSENSKQRWADPEYKERLSAKFVEVNANPETKRKKSEAGKRRMSTPEARAAASERAKQQWSDPEHKQRISDANKGTKPPESTRQAVAEANSKRVWSEEARKKMSDSSKWQWEKRRAQ